MFEKRKSHTRLNEQTTIRIIKFSYVVILRGKLDNVMSKKQIAVRIEQFLRTQFSLIPNTVSSTETKGRTIELR